MHITDGRPRLGDPLRGPAPGQQRRIFDGFLDVARQRPDATAIVEGGRTIAYGALERMTGQLARQLRGQLRPNEIVAIYGKRDAATVAAMIASLRAGFAFAVLDSAYPAGRLAQMVSQLGAARVLVVDALDAKDELAVQQIARRPESILRLGFDDARAANDPAAPPIDETLSTAIAYVLFTSGTTGVPKAIATTHAPLVHFVDWYVPRFEVSPGSRFAMLSGLAHDPIFRDLFVPLTVGAELHIPEPRLLASPQELFHWLDEAGVTHLHGTPQLCTIVATGRPAGGALGHLRFAFSGGDTLRRARAQQWLEVAPGATVVNFYGATETPQAMAYHVFDPADAQDPVPIGAGIADAQVVVLDEQGAVAPIGAVGQVAIRTRYLSVGYLNDEQGTQQRFKPNPERRDASPDDRLYLTGDLGFFREGDAAVVVTGRGDDQVKVRGYRVELGEIAQHLERLPSVEAAIVLPDPTAQGETRLVAYLAGKGESAAVQAALSAVLPAYMVPNLYVWMPRLPLLPNGKIDRAQLRPSALAPSAPGVTAPAGTVEAAIVEHWKHLLGLPAIGVDATFVDLGGDSLSFIQASVQVEALLGTLPDGWERLTIRQLAARKPITRGARSTVDMSVLVRAISIVAIVAEHFDLLDVKDSTSALFIVAGMSFARYQLNAVLRADRIVPILRSVFKIVLPTVLYTLAVQVMFTSLKWQSLVLVNNFVDPNFDNGFTYWFVDVLVQNQLFLAGLLAIASVRRLVRARPFATGWTLWLVFFGVMIVVPHVWSAERLYNRVPHMMIGLMFLGWAVANADTAARKGLCLASGLATLSIFFFRYGLVDWYPATALVLLLSVPRVRLPRPLATATNLAAGSSLFIFLTHGQIGSFTRKIHVLNHKPLVVVIAVVGGIVTWKIWEAAYAAVSLRLRARPTVA
jgi:amino acid adenylation domain-containing protein